MKIAFTYCGHLRTMEYVIPNTLRFIGDLLPNVDFFIHTWEKNENRGIQRNSLGYESLLKDYSADEIEKKFRTKEVPDAFDVLDKIKTIYGDQLRGIKTEKFVPEKFFEIKKISRVTPQWHSWAESIKLKQEYEKKLNFKYDIVIKLRTDICFAKKNTLIDEINYFLTLDDKNKSFILTTDDAYILSSSDVADCLSKYSEQTLDNDVFYKNSGIFPKRSLHYNDYAVYRPETIPTNPLYFKKCKNIDRYWYHNKKYWDPYPDNELDEEN
jgi:hypothetical protein